MTSTTTSTGTGASTYATPVAEITALLAVIDQLKAERTHILTGSIGAGDPRLTTLWETTGEQANDHDMCQVYDEVVEDCGGVSRTHEYDVMIDVSVSATISVTVSQHGRDEDDARERAYDSLSNEDIEEYTRQQIGNYIGDSIYNVDDWEVYDVDRA